MQQPVVGFAILLLVVAGAFLLLLVLAGQFRQLPRFAESAVLAGTWFLLVLAGTFCRDMLVLLFTIPLLLVSLAMAAVVWRSSGSFRKRAAATVRYWAGALAIASAAVYFGAMAADLQCIRQTCHGQYTPHPPHPLRDMILWLPAPLLVAIGLKLSGKSGKTAVGVAAVALWLIDPAILMTVDWLQPSLGM
jgi:hypothetical protein